MVTNRWPNQEEAYQFSLRHPSVMLDMDMGTGKTRVAIDTAFARTDVHRILVACPKAVVPVWRQNLEKFAPDGGWTCWDHQKGTVEKKQEKLKKWVDSVGSPDKMFVIMNYDCVWRDPMGDYVYKKMNFDMVVLDESHRAKSASSKVSRFLAILGKKTKYKMCLSGTPMANSPLDVYGQYRFLDPSIFGTNYGDFLQEYAIMGGPDRNWVIGFKHQRELEAKFHKIAYTCKMNDISERLKLPPVLPPIRRDVELSAKDLKAMKTLSKDFVAQVEGGHIVVNNVLGAMLRMQQIAAGFCAVQDMPGSPSSVQELNSVKLMALVDLLEDISINSNVVVFCVFKHDLESVAKAARKAGRRYFEISGRTNQLEQWNDDSGAILGIQIQAGAEGIDLTKSNIAVYFSLPYSLALYNQSKARLYRPGQTRPVSFIHLIAEHTIDESMYRSLERKEDIIDAIKEGRLDLGFLK